MNIEAQAYNNYKKASVETVPAEKLLLMLYEGALKAINNAKQAIEQKEINLAHQQIMKVEDIIIELMSTLNMEYDISHKLIVLYEYLLNELVQANAKKDIAKLELVEGFLTELKTTWEEAVKQLKNAPAAENQGEPAPPKSINIQG